ncbi:hypothetical protein CEUSTIGMA_g6501.t1 [Chlamydomonas eustigma]|uniref:serine C-palmitoyltransferase n=1 Tax=Chlamydomonas eustigma TaxID=1157962 RepID=A0A250X7J6_9CHLO|nr:hypothetical protein CEUSTIGMA_g6501.t1 [Chlamydomonas eustigma]|eukprot:GAX79061.1 hypothetical protein CEUSTIGMA_g6501.t1 [Chlamydomonas eustigma]
MSLPEPFETISVYARDFWILFGPGGKLHPAYFLEHKGHLLVEGLLLAVILYLFLQNTFKPRASNEEPLTDKEIDTLCKEWQPEPLVPTIKSEDLPVERVVTSVDGLYAVVDGKRVLNLASANFLGLGGTADMKEVATGTVAKYGVGSCGPRGFYGTIDVHLELEKQIAEFMECPQCTIFAYDIATVASVIPACGNRKDIMIADEGCSYPIQQGLTLSRAAVHFFKHNDMQDLERVLREVEAKEKAEKKPLCRKLIVVEGIYANTGDIAKLDEIFAIKEKYKYRLLVEETYSFGVLGPHGRGACEHYGLKAGQVEVICASMSACLGSIGGFVVGETDVVEHQRLAGSGYVFSASLPPFLATSAQHALQQLRSQAKALLPRLHGNCAALRSQIRKIPGLLVAHDGCENSPVIHVHISRAGSKVIAEAGPHAQALVKQIGDVLFQKYNILSAVPLYSCLDRIRPLPSLRLLVPATLNEKEIGVILTSIKGASKEILG